jgi:protein disulfide-isomerase A1
MAAKIYLLVCIIFAINGLISCNPSVTELNIDTFKYFIEENDFVMVMFYSPWCQQCKTFMPEFNKMGKKLAKQGINIKLAKVNAPEQKILSEQHDVVGYPTLIFFSNGKSFEYRGGRTQESMMYWMKNKITPPQHLTTIDELQEFIENSTVSVIGFFKNHESVAAKRFISVTMEDDANHFGIVSSDEIFKAHEADDGSVILFKPYDEGKAVLKGKFTEEKLKIFLKDKALPLVIDFTMDAASLVFDKHFKNHLLMFVSKTENHVPADMDKLRDLAKIYREKILFVAINMDEKEHQSVLNVFGLRAEEIPTMRIVNFGDDGMIKFRPDNDDLTVENIEEFVQSYIDGKIKPDLLSQDLPDDWDAQPVKVLVKSNFYEVAYNTENDVLVEFYSPDCGHCKQLEPVYTELGEVYQSKKNIVIAKIDATKNEMPEQKINGFPTIRIYRKGDNKMEEFEELRTIPKFMEFIEGTKLSGDKDEL